MADTAKAPTEVVIDGRHLSILDVVSVARYGARVRLSPDTYEGIDASSALVERIVADNRRVYGISTGFGEFSKIAIGHEKSAQLQENLILSHCVAVGEPLPGEVVRAMMLLRANALSLGFSGTLARVTVLPGGAGISLAMLSTWP